MGRVDKSARIEAAIEAIRSGEITDYSTAARKYDVDRTTISKRIRGLTKSKRDASSFYRQCLTDAQEEVLISHINKLTDRQMPPTSSIVRNLAEELRGGPVGKNWTSRFVKRHKHRLKSLYLRNIDNLRVSAEYAPLFTLFFALLAQVIEKYNITADNLYNFDEKGFLIGFGRSIKRIMTCEAYYSGRVTKNKQDGNREFISLLACVSAIGRAIPPLLIYKGASGDLQSSWVEDVTKDSDTYFAATENGWSSNKMGIKWLKEVFERHTKPSSPRARRLLLVDGHSSHVNIEFIDWADRHRIIIMILPPHSTHRLQPLDVGLFLPLSTFFGNELNDLISKSGGLVTMSKRMFYPMFRRAWEHAFTPTNIQHAFLKPGIWPVDGSIMIARVTIPRVKPEAPHPIRTPKSAKSIRYFKQAFVRNPSQPAIEKIFSSTETLASQVSILQYENRNLRQAIILEQKKRKKGKRLNLVGEESKGVEIYSPAKVERAREYQATKEAELEAEERAKEERRIQRAANALKKQQIQQEKEDRAAEAQLAKELLLVTPAPKKSTPKKVRITTPKIKKPKIQMPKPKRDVTTPKEALPKNSKKPIAPTIDLEPTEEVVRASRSGRTIRRPLKFLK